MTPADILTIVSETLATPELLLTSKTRKKEVAHVRHIYCWLCREYSHVSLHEIGLPINREHSTVVASIKWVKDKMRYKDVSADIRLCEQAIRDFEGQDFREITGEMGMSF